MINYWFSSMLCLVSNFLLSYKNRILALALARVPAQAPALVQARNLDLVQIQMVKNPNLTGDQIPLRPLILMTMEKLEEHILSSRAVPVG